MARCREVFVLWDEIKNADSEDLDEINITDISSDEDDDECNVGDIECQRLVKESTENETCMNTKKPDMSIDHLYGELVSSMSSQNDKVKKVTCEGVDMVLHPDIPINLFDPSLSSLLQKNMKHSEDFILPCYISSATEVSDMQNSRSVIIKAEPSILYLPDSTSDQVPLCLPPSNSWPGPHNFHIKISDEAHLRKSDNACYHEELNKLYIAKDIPFGILCSADGIPSGCTMRVTPMFSLPEDALQVVRRCPTHTHLDAVKGDPAAEHVVQSLSNHASYELNPVTGRYSIVLPFVVPQDGADYNAYIFKFTCYSSCIGGLNRKASMLVFSLEINGVELGRQVLAFKVCACPSRDMKLDEIKRNKQNGTLHDSFHQFIEINTNKSSEVASTSSEKQLNKYSLSVDDPNLYRFLKQMKMLYEVSALSKQADHES